jgi:hypothetical protein
MNAVYWSSRSSGSPKQSHLPVRRTMLKLGILPGSFHRGVDRYQAGGSASPAATIRTIEVVIVVAVPR